MGAKGPKIPVTPAVRLLRAAKVEFSPHLYPYVERGGATASSSALGVDRHQVIKTLIMKGDKPLIVLMHGDLQVSTGALARSIGVKSVTPCKPEVAERLSGYRVGGTSPFGTRKTMPVYAEASIRDLEEIYINGGKRGFLVKIPTSALEQLLPVHWVSVATAKT